MNNSNAFSAFKIIHRALLAGQLLFMGVMFYLLKTKIIIPPFEGKDRMLQLVAVGVAAIAFFAGNNIFKKRLAALKDMANLTAKQRFEKYRAACTILWAMLETAALLSGLCFFLSGNYAFLALGGLLILFFASMAPDKNKAATQAGLSAEEIDLL
jgi:hypothetical protein